MIPRVLIILLVLHHTVAAQEAIHVVVLEGEGAINNVRSNRAKEPVLRVEDTNNRGVPGAVVTFLLPERGAGAVFGDSGSSLTLTTDDRGEVTARGLRPNRLAGTFQIRVSASQGGRSSSASINQTNVDPGARSSSRMIAIIAVAGAAVAGGAAMALRGGKDKGAGPTAAVTAPATVVVPGTPSFGGPQ
jgi:hypothetical protein